MRSDRPTLRGDEGELYRRYADQLVRLTAHRVTAAPSLIEDACALAWLQLLRRQPERGPVLLGWLRVVALHECYRLIRIDGRDDRLEDIAAANDEGHGEGWESALPSPLTLDDALEARRALEALRDLPVRERRYMVLRVAGYRYQEICELTGATYTNVNKHLTRGRARIRAREAAV